MMLFCKMIQSIKHYLRWKIRRATLKKWKIILSKLDGILVSPTLKESAFAQWGNVLKGQDILQIAALSQISGIASTRYVPEFHYYFTIEPALNHRGFALAYSDKNFYERFLLHPEGLFVPTLLRSMNGVLMRKDYTTCTSQEASDLMVVGMSYIFKPSTSTSGGSDVALISKNEKGQIQLGDQLFASFESAMDSNGLKHGNYIIQQRVQQHSWFAKWNPSSLNTVRLMTYRSAASEEVHHIGSVIRFGRAGSLVDNQAAGGLTCGIDHRGYSREFVCDKYGRSSTAGCFGEAVPEHARMIELAQKLASQFPYHRLLGFDFCVSEAGQVHLLEVNCKNIEVNFMQMNNGPLFGDLLDEVIRDARQHRRFHLFELQY